MSTPRRPVVLLAEKLASSVIDVLSESCDIRNVDGTDRPALLEAVADVDALIVRSATLVNAEVFAAARQLKVVARAGVGLDNVEVAPATARGVMVVNAPTSTRPSGGTSVCWASCARREPISPRARSLHI